jgi:hypothetical protein
LKEPDETDGDGRQKEERRDEARCDQSGLTAHTCEVVLRQIKADGEQQQEVHRGDDERNERSYQISH